MRWMKPNAKWKYLKPELGHIRGICVLCKKNQQKRTYKADIPKYAALCNACHRRIYNLKRYKPVHRKKQKWIKGRRGLRGYQKMRQIKIDAGLTCTKCGFIAKHYAQIDIHHKDRNHKNNSPNNLEVLCANCHRLEHVNGRYEKINPTS